MTPPGKKTGMKTMFVRVMAPIREHKAKKALRILIPDGLPTITIASCSPTPQAANTSIIAEILEDGRLVLENGVIMVWVEGHYVSTYPADIDADDFVGRAGSARQVGRHLAIPREKTKQKGNME